MIEGSPAAVEAYLATPAGEHMALAMAQRVLDDRDAFDSYILGAARYPAAVEVLLDRALDQMAHDADEEIRSTSWGDLPHERGGSR